MGLVTIVTSALQLGFLFLVFFLKIDLSTPWLHKAGKDDFSKINIKPFCRIDSRPILCFVKAKKGRTYSLSKSRGT